MLVMFYFLIHRNEQALPWRMSCTIFGILKFGNFRIWRRLIWKLFWYNLSEPKTGYKAKVPFKKPDLVSHDHFNLCETRLTLYLTQKMMQSFWEGIIMFFLDQMEVAIIKPANETVLLESCHYIPHHLDTREGKSTSNVRIVFDVSAKNEEPSLNECFYKFLMSWCYIEPLRLPYIWYRKDVASNQH